MRRNQSDCSISNLNQSEGRILYHVTWPRGDFFWRSGTEFSLGSGPARPTWERGKPEVTSWQPEVTSWQPEVNGNQRQTTWFDKKHFLFNVLDYFVD